MIYRLRCSVGELEVDTLHIMLARGIMLLTPTGLQCVLVKLTISGSRTQI
jgi:hypothetical protein